MSAAVVTEKQATKIKERANKSYEYSIDGVEFVYTPDAADDVKSLLAQRKEFIHFLHAVVHHEGELDRGHPLFEDIRDCLDALQEQADD